MTWATGYIDRLKKGETVSFRPRGNSMKGKISSGQLCTVSPDISNLVVGEIVLCQVRGAQYLHLITAIKNVGGNVTYQISNNHKRVNGWISVEKIYGRLVSVE